MISKIVTMIFNVTISGRSMVGETTNVLTVTITLTMIMIMSATAETTALIAEPIAEKIAP